MRIRWVIGAVAAAALAIAATVTYASTRDGPHEFAVGLMEPGSLLPGLVDDPAGRLVFSALWTPLTEVDPAGRPVPRLAAEVTSRDRRAWTIRLRPGWRFHDGTPVTARTVVGAWRANLAERWRGAALLADTLRVRGARPGVAAVPGLRVAGEHTVEVTLDAPFAELPLVLSAPALQPLPESALSTRDWTAFAAHPIGTGPYRLGDAWQRGHGASLLRFDGYGGPAPAPAPRVDLRVLDPSAQYAAVRAGDLDLATDVPAERHDAIAREFSARNRAWPQPEATYLGFARTDRRFADPAARRAVSLAIDRAALAAGPLGNQVTPLTALVPPALPGARTGACRACVHDQAAARAALAGAGGPPAEPVPLWYGPEHAGWARALADQLGRNLGITVRPLPATGRTPTDGLFLTDRSITYPSAHPLLVSLVGGTAPELDRLCASAADQSEPDERLRTYRLAENIALRDLPMVPLWSRHGHAVWSARVVTLADAALYGPQLDRTEYGS